MPCSAEQVKEKLTQELDATHVVAGSKQNEITTRGFPYLMMVIGFLLRWAVSLHSYSGQGRLPMFGDYEAQRHWQEVTFNLPVTEWYQNSSRNDLSYWGLDYPPLSAYHSLALGYVAEKIDPDFVELHKSRGFESNSHKFFMRTSSLLADAFIYIPALIVYYNNFKCNYVLAILYPGLILIDHGHFQYNSVSLGLTLLAVYALKKRHLSLGAMLFCLAINYKQIALYHSFPFFFYLLALCLKQVTWFKAFKKLTQIGASVILTFLVVWLPFILPEPKQSLQVLHRVFPVARGLYEDKVASFWCAISMVFKPQNYFDSQSVALLCAVVTLLAVLPSNINLLLKPDFKRFLLCLFNSSIAFFLFSYHVHEKSILFPALSAILLYPYYPFVSVWFLWISSYSLIQLMVKDTLVVPWMALQILFLLIAFKLVPVPKCFKVKAALAISLFGSVVLALCYAFIIPPVKYPHIFPLIIAAFCCVHFMAFLMYFIHIQLKLNSEKLHKS